MLKRLVIVGVGCLAILAPIHPQKSGSKNQANGEKSPAPAITIVDNSTRQTETEEPSQGSRESHAVIEWSNWVVAGVGLLTCWAVWKQANESANATKAMRESVQIQAAAMRQWVDIETVGCDAEPPSIFPSNRPFVVSLRFQVVKHMAVLGFLAFAILVCAQKPLPVQGSNQQEHPQPHTDKTQPDAPPPCISEVCKENASNAERYAYYKAHPKEYLKAAITPANLSNWILAGLGVIGGGLALFTVLTMRWSSERQLRAYVVVERGIIANVTNPRHSPREKVDTVARILDPEAGPTTQITIKNTGQTPAYDLVHWGSLCIREFPLSTKLPTMPTQETKFRTVMGPGIVEVKTVRLPRALSMEEVDGLHNGAMVIYCHGEIEYRDAFKKKHRTRYRSMYGTMGGRIGVNTDLTYCEEGNDAD